MSLRQWLTKLGWHDCFLGADGYYAHIGLRGGRICFLPFGRLQRLISRRALPVEEVIPRGLKVKFLKSIQHDIVGQASVLSFTRLFISLMSRLAGEDFTKMPVFQGLIIEHRYFKNKPFSEFPFDEYLVVRSVDRFDALYQETDGTFWTITHTALTTVTQIEVDIESKHLRWIDEASHSDLSLIEARRIREYRRSLGYEDSQPNSEDQH